MASLVDSFLDDLEELEREDELDIQGTTRDVLGSKPPLCESDDDAPIIDAVAEYFNAAGGETQGFSPLVKDQKLNALIEKVKRLALEEDAKSSELGLMEQCNKSVLEIDNEIINIYNYVRDIYSKRFPKLESIVYSPLDYIAVVRRAQNELDFTKIRLDDLLPNTMIMAMTVAATMAQGTHLSSQVLNKALTACNEGMLLAEFRNDILVYLETRMSLLAPNVSAIIGSALAARLITKAGGLETLAKMPSQNIMLLGGSRKGAIVPGIIYSCEIIQNTVPSVKHRAVKLVSGKLSLAAKIDLFKESRDGQLGVSYRKQIIQALQKAQEPPPAPTKKSLPVPDERKASKRGGARMRKAKERLAQSEFRKYANRLKFGEEAEDEYGLESGQGFGMIGKHTGHGKLTLHHKQTKVQLPKKRQIAMQSSGATNGISSSLVFTPLQGIELCNPDAGKPSSNKKRNSILDNSGGFFKVGKC